MATGEERASLRGDGTTHFSVAFSPDGKILASGGRGETIELWDVVTGKKRATLIGHSGESVYAVTFTPDGKSLISQSGDKTIKLWNIRGEDQLESAQPGSLSIKNPEDLWATLAGGDATQAYRAINTLTLSRQDGISLIKERLPPAPQPNTYLIAHLIADLDSDRFAVRQRAQSRLEKLGEQAAPLLRQKLVDKPSPEVRSRIELVLEHLEQLSPELLRAIRVVEALERIGSQEARQLLETLATGGESARLTQEAKSALQRLAARLISTP